MIEQLIDNWLTKATEKSFQIPFCFMLAHEGYTIVHLTRHCGMEQGKDVLALDPSNTPCAFQLKGTSGTKIKLSFWRKHLLEQVQQLKYTKLMHPSISAKAPHHKSFFVTNGEMDEEVFTAINNDNNVLELNGQPEFKLNVIVKGQLIEKAKRLGLDFIPPDFNDFRLLLEFYLEDGNGTLNKGKFSRLLEGIFNRQIKPTERGNLIRGSALITALATTSYTNKENHVAVVEAWMIYISHLFRFIEQHKVVEKQWVNEFNIAEKIIITSLENLWNECKDLPHFLTNVYLEDGFVHNARATWLLGLVSCLGIIYRLKNEKESGTDEIHKFCKKHTGLIELYGEAAIPNHLAFYWFYRMNDTTQRSVALLSRLINTVLSNIRKPDAIYADVYCDIDESLSLRWEKDKKIVSEKNQKGSSTYLEGLIHLFTRENYRQRMTSLWPDISRRLFMTFRFKELTDFYRWRNREGKEVVTTPKPTKSWTELKSEAAEHDGNDVPALLRSHPHLYCLFINVFPFRGNPSGLRWFDSVISSHS